MSDRWQKLRALVRQPPNTIVVVNADSVGAILAERDELLAALTELHRVALFIHPDEYAAIAAAERLIAGDKTE